MKPFKIGTESPHKDIHGKLLRVGDLIVYNYYQRVHLGVLIRSSKKSACIAHLEPLVKYLNETPNSNWDFWPKGFIKRETIGDWGGYRYNNILFYPQPCPDIVLAWIEQASQ